MVLSAWMDELIGNLECHFYKYLKNTDVANKLINDYPDQPIEVLAETMAVGMTQSICGDVARKISKGEMPYYDFLCKEAFKNAMVRLLNEVTK